MFRRKKEILGVVIVAIITIVCMGLCSLTGVASTTTMEWYDSWAGPEAVPIEKILDLFEQKNPTIKVERNHFSHDDFDTKIRILLASGNPPPVIPMSPDDFGAFSRQGVLKDLTSLWEEKGYDKYFSQSMKKTCTANGTVMAIPFRINPVPLVWYNVHLFEKLGIEPPEKAPTWEEFKILCQRLKDADVVPLGVGGKDKWPLYCWIQAILARMYGGDIFPQLANGTIAWDDPKVLAAFEKWKELLDAGYFTKDPNAYGFMDTFLKLGRSEIAMQAQGSWLDGMFQVELELKPGVDYNYFPFPIINSDIERVDTICVDYVGLFKDYQNLEVAVLLLDFLASAEAQGVIVEMGVAIAPNKNVSSEAYNVVTKKMAKDVAKYSIVPELNAFLHSEVYPFLKTELQRFIADPAKYPEVCAALKAKTEEALKK